MLGSFSSFCTRVRVKMFLQDPKAAALGHFLPGRGELKCFSKRRGAVSGALRLLCAGPGSGKAAPGGRELVWTDSRLDQSWAEASSFSVKGSGEHGLDGNSR